MRVRRIFEPLLILRDREEINTLLAFGNSHDGSYELDQEIRNLEQRRVKVIQEINEKSFDVRTIVILQRYAGSDFHVVQENRPLNAHLIRHNHQPAISQTSNARVFLIMLQPHNFLDILDLLVLHDLVMLGFSHVE
jgi:hypothetical protein